jgi:DNA (cytosine-5)-methyltransferase 1
VTRHPRRSTRPARQPQAPRLSSSSTDAATVSAASSPGPVIGSLCTGAGGLDLGVLAALGAGRIAWCADPDPHVAAILAARMPNVPNLGDLRAVDFSRVEPVDIVTAGFPCQDISAAGKRAGIEKGARSGLWTDIVAAIRVLRPPLVVVENVAALRWKGGGLDRVLGDLAEAGYDALWRSVRAADIGAAHRRERVFLLGWRRGAEEDVAHAAGARWRQPRSRGSSAATRTGAPGEPARRGEHLRCVASDAGSDQSQRRGTSRQVVDPSCATPSAWDQRQRDGHAAVDRRATTADTDSVGPEELHTPDPDRRTVPSGRGPAAADPAGDGRNEGVPRSTGVQRRPDVALDDPPLVFPTDRHRRHLAVAASAAPGAVDDGDSRSTVNWDVYEPAIRRWEAVVGRPVPPPTQPGKHGRPVLAPVFVEHLMGLEPGWVTDLPLPRTAQLRALGNGVVPQQAAFALSLLLTDLHQLNPDMPSPHPVTPRGPSTASQPSQTSTVITGQRAA